MAAELLSHAEMNLHSTIWKFFLLLLLLLLLHSFSNKRGPLLPAGCSLIKGPGYLTVEPAPLFLLGSNLTVYCHITENSRKREERWFQISLELNGQTVNHYKRVNHTTMIFTLFNVRTPQSIVRCKLTTSQVPEIVDGQDLNGGLPPDKPENITCETLRSSDCINCSWERGQETYLPTTYNISVNRENGAQVQVHQIQDADKITIPREMMDENTKYQLIITAYNHFGTSQSDPFILCVKDVVIPETPHIMHIEFGNMSTAAVLHWETTESSEHLRSDVRLRTDNGSWEVGKGMKLSEGLIQMDSLKPLTEYEFKMRTCNSTSGLTHTNSASFTPRSPSSRRLLCSKWSPSVRGRSPGKGPSQQLHVWSMLGSMGENGLRMVTVLWKPPCPEDSSGEVQQYKIFLGKPEVPCHAALSWCSILVPAEVTALNISVPYKVTALSISAVTSYGTSPPADVPLRHSGDFGPVLRALAPADDGSAVFVSWLSPGNKHRSTSGRKLLHYVLEWTHSVAKLQWRQLAKDQNSTSITGLMAGVRYNISLYAVTTRGVSAPSSGLVYSKEQKPKSGPTVSVLVHEARRIRIQWDELPVDQQQGFITNYTIYLQTLDSSNSKLSVTVSGSGPREKWLDCPEGALALQMTASTLAGEGPRGRRISSQPATPAVGLVIVIVFIIMLFLAIIANLMCWSCVRERIKQKCISWGPAWFGENLPKPGNSFAIRLLEQYGSEPLFPSTYSDPPLSPISLISWEERDDMYPNIHVERSQVGSGRQPTAGTPLLISDPGTMLVDSLLEHAIYKPQTAMLAPQGEEEEGTEEEQRDIATSEEEDKCSNAFGGILGDLLSSVELDFSNSPLGLTLCSVNSLLGPKTLETTSVLNGGLLPGRRGIENSVEADSPSLDCGQCEIMTPDTADACLSQYMLETTLTGDYFPQVAAVSSTTLYDVQR